MSSVKSILKLVVVSSLLVGCMSDDKMAEKMKTVLKKNPEILYEAINADPAGFMETLQAAAQNAKAGMEKKRAEAEAKKLEESYNNPLKPEIRADESIRGTKGAPIVLVEYSDFECPFCTRGLNTVNELLNKYKGKVQFIYKHLPLSFHPNAMIAAQYYEAVRLQNADKAFKFHDAIFANQGKLKKGEKFLKAEAKKLGVNMKKLSADIKSDAVKERILSDMKEAEKFGIQGTPGFILNGVPIKGAYPVSHFDKIIGELKKRNKLSLQFKKVLSMNL